MDEPKTEPMSGPVDLPQRRSSTRRPTGWSAENPPPQRVKRAVKDALELARSTGEVPKWMYEGAEPAAGDPWSAAGRLAAMRKVAGQVKGLDVTPQEKQFRGWLEQRPGEFFREMDRLAKELEAKEAPAAAAERDPKTAELVGLIDRLLRPLGASAGPPGGSTTAPSAGTAGTPGGG